MLRKLILVEHYLHNTVLSFWGFFRWRYLESHVAVLNMVSCVQYKHLSLTTFSPALVLVWWVFISVFVIVDVVMGPHTVALRANSALVNGVVPSDAQGTVWCWGLNLSFLLPLVELFFLFLTQCLLHSYTLFLVYPLKYLVKYLLTILYMRKLRIRKVYYLSKM